MNKNEMKRNNKTGLVASLSLLLLKKPIFTAIFLSAIVLFGGLSYTNFLRREGFPSVSVPISVATGTYFVNDSAKVDADVVKPMSEVMQAVEGIESVESFANDNFFTIIARFEQGIDTEKGIQNLKDAVSESTAIAEEANVDFLDINPAKYLSKYDLVVSVYTTTDASHQEIEEQANKVASVIAGGDEVSFAEVLPLFESGINPATGESVVQQSSFSRFGRKKDGKKFQYYNAVAIGVGGHDGETLDIFKLSENVSQKLAEANEGLSDGFEAEVSADFTEVIGQQINSLQNNVLTGLMAVTLISFLMISWRVSILSVVFMVSVIFVTSGILYIFGYTLNTITLFALVLSLGLFVDDATIVSEAIDAAKSKKLSAKETISQAITSIGAATVSGTVTTVLVFVPLLFVTGVIGSFIYLLPVTVIISLLVSLFLSLTMIPFLSQYTILTKSNMGKKPRANPIPDWIANSILLLKTNKKKGLIVGSSMVALSVVAVLASGFFAGKLTFNIFPPSKDSNEIAVALDFKPGTSIAEAEAISDEVNEVIVATVGDELSLLSYSRDEKASNRSALVFIGLTHYKTRELTSVDFVDQLEEILQNYGKASIAVFQLDSGPPVEKYPFKMQVSAENFTNGQSLANDLQLFLAGASIERANGTTAQITAVEIVNVDNVARNNGTRIISVQAAYDANDVTALLKATQEKVEAAFGQQKLSEYGLAESDLEFDFGQESENEESFSSLGSVALVAVAVMFILLAIQFKSILEPLLIFLALPFSLLGVTFGLYISDNPLSFFALVGLVGLIGIAVNNTILLTDYANQCRRNGMDIIEAIAEATRTRFRPLFTTTATTVAALAPLALSDPFWESLAITIMFGLVSSTILVILAFPYYYIAAGYISQYAKRLVLRK